MTIDSDDLEIKISELLSNFYQKRIESLQGLQLDRTLKRKNPYLYRATGTVDAAEIVEELLRAHVSSSDETLFGNEFFEPLAKWVAEKANPSDRVTTSHGEGIDISIESDDIIKGIAIKSGVNVFNAQSPPRSQ
ncbi:PmeII family type II restriction endonuclease [Castellaniella hirudinis]|uniref:PmeII family type II restriction endonuclease n=1 Tax=Castellaniella hirudinis TaxID=1144617 RepID=UPI0039C2C351